MSRNTQSQTEMSTSYEKKWSRRDVKKRPKMRVHGQGVKKLTKTIGDKKSKGTR